MKDHYGFTDSEMAILEKNGVTIMDLFHAVKEFKAEEAEPSQISLYHYADTHGDFFEPRKPSDFIAMALFEKLDLKEKINLAEYVEFLEGDEDE